MEFIGSSHRSRDIGAFLRRAVKTLREAYRKRKYVYEEYLRNITIASYFYYIKYFMLPCSLFQCSLNVKNLR